LAFKPRVLNTGPLPGDFGAGILTPWPRRQLAKWVRAVRNAVCWTAAATAERWLDVTCDRSDRSRSTSRARAFALSALLAAARELPAWGLVALELIAVELVAARAVELLCVVPDEPPHAASPLPASARVEARTAARPHISILPITFLFSLFSARGAWRGTSIGKKNTRLSRGDRNDRT
jgi:hypothetical protein